MGRAKSRIEISTGMCSFHYHDFSRNQRRSKPKGLELAKISKWNAYIPFGNFGLPFGVKKSRFPEKISVRGDKINLPFAFHPNFPDNLGKWETTVVKWVDKPTRLLRLEIFAHLPFSFRSLDHLLLHSCL